MLGLPDEVHGRVPDLNRVLTLTAPGHAAARKRILVAAGRVGGFTITVDGEHLAELLDGR